MQAHELSAHLAQFTGSASLTRHRVIRSVLMTEGITFLSQAAGAHWLTDAVASYGHDSRASAEPFQVWRLTVDPSTRRATLAMTDGNTEEPIITQDVDYTDFPLDEITIWLIAEENRWVMLLPSEY
jgi:hypothetical protein